ncbi:Hypothetical protein DPCES_5082 [Desulfitobacterium hafniense]|uniref:Uncharacterized protein n=1 Tax=Desulfitobacterium hafniense TaxID=49338 RepID=A0A098B7X2_DESHA|nr:hypothetical protein [Desulfitobacterium hafniense]CDX04968.1 Hypothetical protein DPCES_5082 [Desulfitobacterium hafniense]
MTFTIWKIITNFIAVPLIWVWFFNQVLEPRYKQKWSLLLQVVLLDVFAIVTYFLFDHTPLRLGISIIGNLLILHVFFRNHLGHKLFTEIICKLCYVGAEILSSIWIPLVFHALLFRLYPQVAMIFKSILFSIR